jgi:hypothetical protein
MSRLRIDQYPTRIQNQIAAQMGQSAKAEPAPVSKPRIRQNSAGLNKTEQAYSDYLRLMFKHVYREPSLPLANGLRYKVDFVVVSEQGRIEGHEVKGRAYSTGIAKLKMAASLYPWIKFRLVTKRKGGGWDIQEVLL